MVVAFDHDVPLSKLEHYGIRSLANEAFRFYFPDRKKYVSSNVLILIYSDYNDSNPDPLKIGVTKWSVLYTFFKVFFNGLQAIQFYYINQFVDDSNLLHFSKSVNEINKYINLDLKNLVNW